MRFKLEASADRPAYLQIVDQVRYGAAAGRIRPGEALPSIRQLAEQLRINRNTVDKAYRELHRLGVIKTARGRGAFLSDSGADGGADHRTDLVADAVDALILKARQLRIGPEELATVIRERYEAQDRSPASTQTEKQHQEGSKK